MAQFIRVNLSVSVVAFCQSTQKDTAMSTSGKILLIVGIILVVLGLCGGLGLSVLGLVGTFDIVAAQGGAASPADLASGISMALVSTAVGLPVALVGLVLLVVGLIVGLKSRTASNEATQ